MKAFGQPAFDSGVTLKDNAVFWLASMTKLVTAIAILQCLEGVLFQLDSVKDTERLLPEWKGSLLMTDVKPEYVATEACVLRLFTIRELLSHTSGLGADGTPPLSIWRQQRNEGSVWLSGNLVSKSVGNLGALVEYTLNSIPARKLPGSPTIRARNWL